LESFTCQNDGENIKIYEGLVEGKIIASEDISSFDYYFEVTRFGKKLGELNNPTCILHILSKSNGS
jgi:inosine/xanthosine triphosphate pyrophosphatase family protein